MQNLKRTDVLNILKRIDQDSYHEIAKTIIILELKIIIRGWRQGINDPSLFRQQYMHRPALNNRMMEPAIWKMVYETDLLFGFYEKNYIGFKRIVEKEKYIQHSLELIQMYEYNDDHIMEAMRAFKTPNFTGIGELEFLLNAFRIVGLDLALCIDYLITLHNWPNCFGTRVFNESNFWYSACEVLTGYMPINDGSKKSLRDFLFKYHTKFDWKKNWHLYQCIDEEFILAHPEIPFYWTSVLCYIKLSEPLLTEIMQAADSGKQFNNQTPNIAYMAEKQVLSEEFVEKWFVSKLETKRLYDQDHIWDQLLRHQNLSEEFRAKYNHKRSKPRTHALRSILQARAIAEQAPPKEDVAFSSNIQSLKDYLLN